MVQDDALTSICAGNRVLNSFRMTARLPFRVDRVFEYNMKSRIKRWIWVITVANSSHIFVIATQNKMSVGTSRSLS